MSLYNEHVKKEYIQRKAQLFIDFGGELFISKIFVQSYNYENVINKDLFDFTKEEIMNLYLMFRTKSVFYLSSINTIINHYITWAIERGYSTNKEPPTKNIKETDLNACISPIAKNKTIITEDELYITANAISLNPSDQFLLLAPFYGIYGKELCELSCIKREDINIEKNTVSLCTNRTLEIPEKLISIMIKSLDTYKLYTRSKKGGILEVRLAGDTVYKTTATDYKEGEYIKRMQKHIHYRFGKVKYMCNLPELSLMSIRTSGFVHFSRNAMNKYNMIFYDFMLSDISKHVCERFNIKRDPQRIIQRYKKYF